MRLDSPLRYPGGKASLADFLARTIVLNALSGCSYFEPFAGGAGAALRLLGDGIVSELYLNDADPRITAFWQAVLHEPDRFADAIRSVPVNVEEWKRQQNICRRADTSMPFELGFSTFYLNRCNRSGILFGSAPIGGYAQAGKWKMNVRFYRKSLAARIRAVARKREYIHVTNMDAREFLVKQLPRGRERKRVFAYLDPPYYLNGNRLYLNFYEDQDHRKLSRYLQRQSMLHWVMSYDDAPFIRDLYATSTISHLSLQHSLQQKKQEQELLIAPSHVRIPDPVVPIERREEISMFAQGGGFDE